MLNFCSNFSDLTAKTLIVWMDFVEQGPLRNCYFNGTLKRYSFFFFSQCCLVSEKFDQTKEIFGSRPSTMKLLFRFSQSLFNSKDKKMIWEDM